MVPVTNMRYGCNIKSPNFASIVLKSSRACYLLYRCFLSVFLMIEAYTGNWRWFHHSRHLWLWPLSSCWQGFFFKKSSDFIWDYQSLGDDAFLPLPPREILKNTTGNCGHVLRRMVLGDNGRMDKVKRVCRKNNSERPVDVLAEKHHLLTDLQLGIKRKNLKRKTQNNANARLATANNLTTYRYLFNHNSALGLLVLEGVPHPERYGLILIFRFCAPFTYVDVFVPLVIKISCNEI